MDESMARAEGRSSGASEDEVAGLRERLRRAEEERALAEAAVWQERAQSAWREQEIEQRLTARRSGKKPSHSLLRLRALRHLGGWLLSRSSPCGPRNLRELIAIRRSRLFDRDFYLRNNPGVRKAGMHPVIHYIEYGAAAGIDPGPGFDTRRYLAAHPELLQSNVNPLYHYLRSGEDEAVAGIETRPYAVLAGGAAVAEPERIRSARQALALRPLRVSVVIPTLNRASVLPRALASALGQSYPALELIVVDDGGSDGTEQMVRSRFAAEIEAGTVRFLRSSKSLGASGARNLGLAEARGDLVAYLDSDNSWRRDFLLLMAGALAQHEEAATAYCALAARSGPDEIEVRFSEFDRERLLVRNFIDLNAFVHRKRLVDQLGGFDEELTRLIDWDLILRYTRPYPPIALAEVLVDYDASESSDRITHLAPFDRNAAVIRSRVAAELVQARVSPPRIGYVLWDWPALSQSFVLSEIRELIARNYDVRVYFHADPDRSAQLDFEVEATRVADADELARLITADRRTVLHSHFAYPAVTKLTWPAAKQAGVPFTVMAHAVDIFHRLNAERNEIDKIAADPLCMRIYGAGEHHRSYLISRGVPAEKIAIARQASEIELADEDSVDRRMERPAETVACVARFVEKKGIEYLIRAATQLPPGMAVKIYGYGPLEDDLSALAERLGADNVSFEGGLESGREVAAALSEADIFALPCIVDSDGDMDGLPTVIGEAMASGVPVVTTSVSSIPELVRDEITGFVVPPKDAEALARRIAEVASMDRSKLRRVVDQARAEVPRAWSLDRILQSLLDTWVEPPIEIGMVTYHQSDYPLESTATTLEIIRRVYELTTTPFKLTIVDNASDAEFRAALAGALAGRANASLVLLDENRHWGPALNVAYAGSRSDFLLYVCSNEGFTLRPAWERHLIDQLRDERELGMVGHRVSSPAFPTGRDYTEQEWFGDFRNKAFAVDNPGREFFHVQGGLFAIRAPAFASSGGFSDRLTHNGSDVEFSHMLESLGWKLGEVATIPSVSSKTRPRLRAHLDERTVAAHPLSLDSVELAERISAGQTRFCNICAWSGDAFDPAGSSAGQCPSCQSTPFGRLAFRLLASTSLPFRGLRCLSAEADPSLSGELRQMFDTTESDLSGLSRLDDSLPFQLAIADLTQAEPSDLPTLANAVAGALAGNGLALLSRTAAVSSSGNGDRSAGSSLESWLKERGFAVAVVAPASRALRFPADGLLQVTRSKQIQESAGDNAVSTGAQIA